MPPAEPAPTSSDRTEAHRDRMLAFQRDNPSSTRWALVRAVSSSYKYLLANHRALLLLHLPIADRLSELPDVDLKMAAEVPKAAARLYTRAGKPLRVSRTSLEKEPKPTWFVARKGDRFPLTMAAIASHEETTESVARRRLFWTAAAIVRRREDYNWSRFEHHARVPESLLGLARELHAAAQEAIRWEYAEARFAAALTALSQK